jgi:hypothetical protein
MIDRFTSRVLAVGVCSALVATPVLAEKAADLTFLNGSSAGQVERTIHDRGFRHVSSHRSGSGYVHSYWWQDKGNHCIDVEADERSGNVMTINDAPVSDCGHSGKISGGEAAAIGVGAALLGALLTSGKSHHKDGAQYDQQQTAEFDRGYSDGLYNASYHNRSRSDAYAKGYEKGVEEREANLRHHSRRGGYVQAQRIDDLQGARAAGGMSDLEARGFRQVDNFVRGDARYSIQWQSQTRQCVQVIVTDGKIYDIRDIGTHPNCR